MITSAGRLRRTTSQGSPSRSKVSLRPMAMPKSVPKTIASPKETMTRASVIPRLKKRAPECASRSITATTAPGSGKTRLAASIAATCQIAISRTSERIRRATSVLRHVLVEGASIELSGRSDELGSAELREHQIELARIRFLGRDLSLLGAFEVALTIKRKRLRIGNADERRKLLPIGIGMSQYVLRLAGQGEEAAQNVAMLIGETLVEHIADHRDWACRTQALFDVVNADQAAESMKLEVDAEIPEIQRRIALTL